MRRMFSHFCSAAPCRDFYGCHSFSRAFGLVLVTPTRPSSRSQQNLGSTDWMADDWVCCDSPAHFAEIDIAHNHAPYQCDVELSVLNK